MAGAELATYKNQRFLKPSLWFMVIPVFTYAFVLAWLDSARFTFPGVLSAIAWFPFILFSGLFIYSACVEIPLKAYTASLRPTKVVINGTYSLIRHPAALWFVGWLVSAIFASQSVILAIAAPIWIAAYIGCIVLEDKLNSLGDFGNEYKKYQMVTPMLIPTRTSISHFYKEARAHFRPNFG